MRPLTFYEINWEVECRNWDKCEWIHRATRTITTNVSEDIFDTIIFWDLREAKTMMRNIYDSLTK